MHIGDAPTKSPTDDVIPSRSLRKSTRIHDAKPTPASSPTQRAKEEEVSSSVPPSSQSAQKRAAPVDEVVNREDTFSNDRVADNPSPQTVVLSGSGESSPHICLCQPEPKIPRPRNAFILYRQHHQQAIIARNPGLNNSEISKIIGEQWKAEAENLKKGWQDLAEDEKVRHQEQYPDYRYQPRRTVKPGSSPLNPSVQHTTVDKYRCPRCGGRSIKIPTSPFVDAVGTPTLPPPNTSDGLTTTTRYLPVMSNLGLASPVWRRGHGPSSLSNIQVPPLREETAMYSPLTPGNKKRRFDYGPPPSSVRRPDGPYYPQYARRDSLPPIQVRYSPPNSATMPPPRTPHDGRRSSLADISAVSEHHDHSSRSVEEVLMTFPYQNKIKLLGRISLPYKGTTLINPALQIRGAIIAVEGDDTGSVKTLSDWLNGYFTKDKETSYYPRIIEPPKIPSNEDATFEDYLHLIEEWHVKSKDMIKYITTADPKSHFPDAATSEKDYDKGPVTNERKDSASASNSPVPSATTPSRASPTPCTSIKPIIIIPSFQLAASVAYASRIPIEDAYSMTDHWQWMATLWRGTVGPDLTIYVKTHEKEGSGGSKPEMDDAGRCLSVEKEKDGKFTDADLRRVGFEVSEFIKGMACV
ncbi:hypothetical protein GQ44DRAFT_606489 [Phaeosphaeriaceae sp. PMI808]|nr:hypothetical protein GQ44DRAFT_606489 [Phaeosphaeriaceae sp. PMI808]